MRHVLAALLAMALLTSTAHAAKPFDPTSDRTFKSWQEIKLVAERFDSDQRIAFLVAPQPSFAGPTDRWFSPGDDDQIGEQFVTTTIDAGLLTFKLNHLGRFWWTTCPVAANEADPVDTTVVTAACAPPATFQILFEHKTLTGFEARTLARQAIRSRFAIFRDGYGQRATCKRRSRIQMRCKVSAVAGDTVLYGTVNVFRKRVDDSSLDAFTARMTQYDEYCHLVNKRPLRSCQKVFRRSGLV